MWEPRQLSNNLLLLLRLLLRLLLLRTPNPKVPCIGHHDQETAEDGQFHRTSTREQQSAVDGPA
ncbi:MAG: hypothetical protein ACKPKO_48500, partial [Candidatus Fonsibacter sp.]